MRSPSVQDKCSPRVIPCACICAPESTRSYDEQMKCISSAFLPPSIHSFSCIFIYFPSITPSSSLPSIFGYILQSVSFPPSLPVSLSSSEILCFWDVESIWSKAFRKGQIYWHVSPEIGLAAWLFHHHSPSLLWGLCLCLFLSPHSFLSLYFWAISSTSQLNCQLLMESLRSRPLINNVGSL